MSIELLETFVSVLDHDGDAMAAARELGINQPSMSKRLAVLQHAGRGLPRPWLERAGKTWAATEEGCRVLPAVRDLCSRYDRLSEFVEDSRRGLPAFTFACGQQAATSFVLRAAQRFHRENPDVFFRISQLRGRARIEGVANGWLDLAAVTDDEESIAAVARRELHIDALPPDPLVLVGLKAASVEGAPPPWLRAFTKLPVEAAPAEALRAFPLILPEPDADVRRQIEQAARSAGVRGEWHVALEVGGWQVILAYARLGLGVGVVTQTAFEQCPDGLVRRRLDPKTFPPTRVRLICRKRAPTPDELDLAPAAHRFRQLILAETAGSAV
jgi:DNA-binding transcriptional LysR family regulator